MSITYIGAIVQFLIVTGFITQTEATIIGDGVTAIVALVTLLITLYGRFRLGGVKVWGGRE